MHPCLGATRVLVSRAVSAPQANEHYEPLCGAPRYRARPEA
jgi:hypothetical protein